MGAAETAQNFGFFPQSCELRDATQRQISLSLRGDSPKLGTWQI
jgi:hypothetical protein